VNWDIFWSACFGGLAGVAIGVYFLYCELRRWLDRATQNAQDTLAKIVQVQTETGAKIAENTAKKRDGKGRFA